MKKILVTSMAIFLTACGPTTPEQPREVSEGVDGDKPYTLSIANTCEGQIFNFDRIRFGDDAKQSGIDVGVFFDEEGACAGIWQFDFEAGALLANVRPDLDEKSFALIRQEGDEIFISALEVTTGWTVASHEGGSRETWLGVLPAVKTIAGEPVNITFANAEGTQQIKLRFAFAEEIGTVTITELETEASSEPSA